MTIKTVGLTAFFQKGLAVVELPSCAMAPPVEVDRINIYSVHRTILEPP